MRILLVKTSSLGDVIHNLPLAADLAQRLPQARIDWCVEEGFADIPRLAPAVQNVLPVAIRRWRRRLFSPATWREIGALRRQIAAAGYDAVLDSQGLLKSAVLTRFSRGQRLGYDVESAREPLAARFYDATFFVPRELHAVERNRRLGAAAFAYALPPALDYGIVAPPGDPADAAAPPTVVLFTATSRDDKLWDEANWVALGQLLAQRGFAVLLPAGSARERERAGRIVQAIAAGSAPSAPPAQLLPPLTIGQLAGVIGRARLAIGVDTGLAHLAAALAVPTIAIYTATDPALTGVVSAGFARNLGCTGLAPKLAEVLACAEEALHVA